jgi:hypothetical protein
MDRAPDGPSGRGWWVAAGVVALIVTAVALRAILRSGSDAASSTTGVVGSSPSHAPCVPTSSGSGDSVGVGGSATTADWTIKVSDATAEPTVPAQDGGTYRAAPGEFFVVVEATFVNAHPGTEASLSSTDASLVCEDRNVRKVAGLDDGRGFCRVCAFEIGTDQKRVRWTFLFRMEQGSIGQTFQFAYGEAEPIPFTITNPTT